MIQYPQLETHRMQLRELTLLDKELVFKHFSDPLVTEFMDIDPCKSVEEAEEIIQFHVDDTGCRYGLFDKKSGELVGTAGFHCWVHGEHPRAEIGFDLASKYWGQGLMQEALDVLIHVGFELMKLDFIEATVEQGNLRSQKLMEKMNFIKHEELRDNLIYYTLHKI